MSQILAVQVCHHDNQSKNYISKYAILSSNRLVLLHWQSGYLSCNKVLAANIFLTNLLLQTHLFVTLTRCTCKHIRHKKMLDRNPGKSWLCLLVGGHCCCLSFQDYDLWTSMLTSLSLLQYCKPTLELLETGLWLVIILSPIYFFDCHSLFSSAFSFLSSSLIKLLSNFKAYFSFLKDVYLTCLLSHKVAK